jgi:hypothetical protein
MRTRRFNRTDWLILLVELCGCGLFALGQSHVLLGVLGALTVAITSALSLLRSHRTG